MNRILHQSKKVLLMVLFSLSLYSCEYETNEVYNNPANKEVTPPQIETINLDFNNDDTIYIYSPDIINFSFTCNGKSIDSVQLFIDNSLSRVSITNSGFFSIDNSYLSIGAHKIRIDALVKPGTGSIAEGANLEYVKKSKAWVLVNQELNTSINKIYQNGFQTLTWPKCKSKRLIEYVVYCSEEKFRTSKSNCFVDSSYLGDQRTMSVKVRLEGDVYLDWGRVYINNELPKLNFKATENNEYILSWDKFKYYNAIDSVKIYIHSYDENKNIFLKKTTNVNDTSLVIDKKYFGEHILICFQNLPKRYMFNEYDPWYRYFVQQWLLPGIKFIKYSKIFPISNNEFIVDIYDSLSKYSIPNKTFTGWIGGLAPSSQGDTRVSCRGNYITGTIGIYTYSCTNFCAPTNSWPNFTTLNIKNQIIESVSDNGLGITLTTNDTMNIFDLATSNKLASYRRESLYPSDIKFSSNGDYFLIHSNDLILYQFKDNQINEIARSSDFKYYEFDSQNTNQYVTWNGSKIFIKQLPDNTIINQYALTDYALCNIDFFNREMLTYSNGYLYVRSLVDGSILTQIESKLDNAYIDKTCHLKNHTIFCKSGVLYNLNTK